MAVGSSAPTLTLTEKDGGVLTLTQRALPHWPMTISGKQRAEFTWYPGSPQAVVQMLGPEEGVINLKGFWKDKFIQGTNAAQYVSAEVASLRSAISSTVTTTASIPDVATLVSIVDTMRRMGREITLQWYSISRRGHITEFTQSWQTPHYCEWELEFSVSAQEEASVAAVPSVKTSIADAATTAQGWVNTNKDLLDRRPLPPELTPLQAFQQGLFDLSNSLTDFSNSVMGAAQMVANYAMAPGEAVKQVMTASQGVATAANNAARNLGEAALTGDFSIGTFLSTSAELIATGGESAFREDGLPFGINLAGNDYLNGLRSTWRQIAYSATFLRWNAQLQLQDDLIIAFTAKQDMDLRDVSTQFYNTPDYWRDLMVYNGLTNSRLVAGQLIWVPRNPTSTGAGNTYGGGP